MMGLTDRLLCRLRDEHLWPAVYGTNLRGRDELAGHVEFTNRRRVHQALGYCTPVYVLHRWHARPGLSAWVEGDETEEYVTTACLACPGQAI